MRYVTTTEESNILHEPQEPGRAIAHCGAEAPYDTDHEATTFGLLAGTLHVCRPCEMAAVNEQRVAHGHSPETFGHEPVEAAVATLAQAGHEPARITAAGMGTATGFLVDVAGGNCVAVCRLVDGRPATDGDAYLFLDAYWRALHLAGWRTYRSDDWKFSAWRPAEGNEAAVSLTPQRPGQRAGR